MGLTLSTGLGMFDEDFMHSDMLMHYQRTLNEEKTARSPSIRCCFIMIFTINHFKVGCGMNNSREKEVTLYLKQKLSINIFSQHFKKRAEFYCNKVIKSYILNLRTDNFKMNILRICYDYKEKWEVMV